MMKKSLIEEATKRLLELEQAGVTPRGDAKAYEAPADVNTRAEVNGRSARVFRAHYLWRGVMVPAGKSRVVFRFAPRTRWPLTIAFVVGLGGALGLMVVPIRERRGRGA